VEQRGRIWAQTLLVMAVWAGLIFLAWRTLFRGYEPALSLALAFVVVQSAAIAVMLFVLLTRRGMSARRAMRSLRVSQAAADAVAEHAAGNDRLRVLRELRAESKRDTDRALVSFLAGTRGSMHDRVLALARDLGADTSALFHHQDTETLFDRILLADETRGRAASLASTEIAAALASGDEKQMIAALDLLRAWRVVLHVPNFERALTHPSEEVRYRAHLLGGVQAFLPAFADPSPKVRAAAAHAAAKLRQFSPQLEALLLDEHREVAVAAAFALAATAEGREVLQRHVTEGNRVAFEAIEKATMGRLELA
jgi:hypothetical protein